LARVSDAEFSIQCQGGGAHVTLMRLLTSTLPFSRAAATRQPDLLAARAVTGRGS
jgi:hypothetical protein